MDFGSKYRFYVDPSFLQIGKQVRLKIETEKVIYNMAASLYN